MDLADSQAKHYEASESVKHSLLPIRRKCLQFSWKLLRWIFAN